MKQQGRRAARAGCVRRKRLKLLEKAYLLCIILSWLGWSGSRTRALKTRALKTRVLKTRALKDTSPKGHES